MFMILMHPLPFLVFLRILVYEMWPGAGRFIIPIRLDRLLRRGFPKLSTVLQIAVIPFEIDVPRHLNLDDYALPRIGLFPVPGVLPCFAVVVLDVVFEQFDVVFADGCCKQLAKICKRIVKVFWFADVGGIDDPAHPYFVQLVVWRLMVLFDQAFEIDGVDQSPFAICNSVDLYGSFDERQSRTRTQGACVDRYLVLFLFGFLGYWTIGKQRELLPVKIPSVVEYEWLSVFFQLLEIYALHKLAIRIVDPGQAVDIGQVHHGRQIADEGIGRHRLVENPPIEVPFIQFFELLLLIAVRQLIEQKRHGVLEDIHHSVRVPQEVFIIVGVGDEAIQSFYVAAPIRSEDGVYGKALIAFVVSKNAILEELVSLLYLIFLVIPLIINDPNPSADAGQCPHIKRYTGGGKSFQNPDVQPCCRSTTAERNRSF